VVLLQFGDLLPFLQAHLDSRLQQQDYSTSHRCSKIGQLIIELAAVVDCGESFVKATYNLKGEGAVVFNSYEIVDVLSKGVQTAHFPNLYAVARKLSTTQPTPGGSATIPQRIIAYGKSCIQLRQDYFVRVFQQLNGSVRAFKAAQMFVPPKE